MRYASQEKKKPAPLRTITVIILFKESKCKKSHILKVTRSYNGKLRKSLHFCYKAHGQHRSPEQYSSCKFPFQNV